MRDAYSRSSPGPRPRPRGLSYLRVTVVVALLALLLPGRPTDALPGNTIRFAPENREQSSTVIAADRLVAQLMAGERVDLEGVELDGPVDLRPVGDVKAPVRCQRCTFRGTVDATDVVFERLVDLKGSTFEAPLLMQGTLFREHAAFDEATFGGVTLASARFLDGASFARAKFRAQASFESTRVARTGDFSQSSFAQGVTFERAEFEGKVNFTLAAFQGEAHFEGSDLGTGGSFRVAVFSDYASFERLSSGGSVDFVGATFEADANLSDVASPGILSLEEIQVVGDHRRCARETAGTSAGGDGNRMDGDGRRTSSACLLIERVAVEHLRMEVDSVRVVAGAPAQKQLLQVVERSAEARKDLGVANDARFRRLSIEGEEKTGLARQTDRVLYRGVAGYFVKPSHPLSAFLVLLLVASLVRGVHGLSREAAGWRRESKTREANPSPGGVAGRAHDLVLRGQQAGAVLLRGLAASLPVAVRRKPGIAVADAQRVRAYFAAGVAWLEFLSYRVLVAAFLVALGNSNATVRLIFDAVVS